MRRLWRAAFPRHDTAGITVPGVGPLAISGCAAADPFIFGRLQRGEMFEPHILAGLAALIAPGATVIDVGANIGLFTLCAARLAGPQGRVLAVEPEAGNVRLLRRNIRQNGIRHVRVLAAAASRHEGTARLGLSQANAGDHRLASQSRQAGIAVRTLRLDDLVREPRGLLVLKLDIQGSEVAALSGAARLLAGSATVRVLAEFWPHGLVDCGSSADALVSLLEHHFQRFWILWSHCGPLPITPAGLRHAAATNLAPATEMFADIVALRASDTAGIAAMERREAAG